MKTPLAWLNLIHNKTRTLVAAAGITFAITLVFMQLGFFSSVLSTAVAVYDQLDFDLLVVSPNYVSLTQAGTVPRRRLYQVRSLPQIVQVMPLYVGRAMWTHRDERIRRSVIMLGINPADRPFLNPEIDRQRHTLVQPDHVLVDRLSRPELGPIDVGVTTELNGREMEITGQFSIGPGFEVGNIVVGEQAFSRLLGGYPLNRVSLGLVKLQPGLDPQTVAAELDLPADVTVLTRAGIDSIERWYWVTNTSTGVIFGSGVLVAIAFGIVITYQVLSTEISSRLGEYATLKAIGQSDGYLARVVVVQGVMLSLMSYVPAFVLALIIYEIARRWTNLPVGMTNLRAVVVLLMAVIMCSISAMLSVRIVQTADPADVF